MSRQYASGIAKKEKKKLLRWISTNQYLTQGGEELVWNEVPLTRHEETVSMMNYNKIINEANPRRDWRSRYRRVDDEVF